MKNYFKALGKAIYFGLNMFNGTACCFSIPIIIAYQIATWQAWLGCAASYLVCFTFFYIEESKGGRR